MPINTRTKRQNVAQIGCPLPVSVLPSGTIGVAARYQISWSYGGNTTPPPTGTAIEDRVFVGMRQGVQGSDVNIGGFN